MASTTRSVFAPIRTLSVESLETRLNLSTLAGSVVPWKPESFPLTRTIGTHLTSNKVRSLSSHAILGGSSLLAIGNDSWIAPGAYSAISNSQLESRKFGQDIGFVSTSGAYVEYRINVVNAGTYTLNVGIASEANAVFSVSSDGTPLATYNTKKTGAWDNIVYFSQSVTLAAGTQTIRFSALNGTQYNLNSFELRYQDAQTVSNPVLPVAVPVVDPAPIASTPVTTPAVSVSQRLMTSFTELDIKGISSNGSIYVSQSGDTLTINTGDSSQQVRGTFGTLVVSAGDGAANITIDSSVTLPTTVYSGAGDDTIVNATQGQAVIVTLDGGKDTVSGNGINTAFWVAPGDTVNATAKEVANGGVHVISSMYQPAKLAGGKTITSIRDGSTIADPTAATSTTTRLPSSSFFGAGPVMEDVNQGQSSDCYYLTALESLAKFQPGKLQQLGVDLGDGTYVIAFQRNGQKQYVRVDGDLPSSGPYANGLEYAHPGVSGNEWAPIFEKAYAYFRAGTSSYSSLDYGVPKTVYNDFGIADTMTALPASQSTFYTTASSSLGANKPVDILTNGAIVNGAPLVQAHTYSVIGVSQDSRGTVWVTLRNPWGFDGFNVDSNSSDGILTISYATMKANAYYMSLMV